MGVFEVISGFTEEERAALYQAGILNMNASRDIDLFNFFLSEYDRLKSENDCSAITQAIVNTSDKYCRSYERTRDLIYKMKKAFNHKGHKEALR